MVILYCIAVNTNIMITTYLNVDKRNVYYNLYNTVICAIHKETLKRHMWLHIGDGLYVRTDCEYNIYCFPYCHITLSTKWWWIINWVIVVYIFIVSKVMRHMIIYIEKPFSYTKCDYRMCSEIPTWRMGLCMLIYSVCENCNCKLDYYQNHTITQFKVMRYMIYIGIPFSCTKCDYVIGSSVMMEMVYWSILIYIEIPFACTECDYILQVYIYEYTGGKMATVLCEDIKSKKITMWEKWLFDLTYSLNW